MRLCPPYTITRSLRLIRERAQNPRPGADALVETLEVILLVRRMDVVVVEAEADQEAVEAERALEIRDDRDRGAGADQARLLAPFLGQRALGGGQRLHVPIERDRSTTGVLGKDGLAVARKPRGDVVAERLLDLLRVLAFDQTEGHLGGRFRRDHGFRTLAGIAADDAVDVAGRTRGYLLDQQAILFAGGDREADRLQERLRRQVESLPLRQDIRRQIL